MYTYKKKFSGSFEDAVERVREELSKRGFGVLTEIDVKEVLKKKLGVEHPRYLILGACNPHFSHKVLQEEKEIGALLPCNVIVYEDGEGVFISTVLPTAQLAIVPNQSIKPVAEEVEKLLKEVVDNV